MPDVWTHIFCGREVLAGVEADFARLARSQKELFYLGCQGPDLFFYYKFFPWYGERKVFLLGSSIHDEKCGLLLRESLKYLKENPNPRLTVYLMAFICHWCLDRITHPYINHIAGEYPVNNHKRVEAAIDVLMGQRLYSLNVRNTPVYREIYVGDSLPGEIVHFYRYILSLVFKDSYGALEGLDFVNKSYRDMITALRVFYDPRGVKRAMASVYDRLTRGRDNISYYFYRSPEKNGEIYLNEKNDPWRHPMDGKEVYTESFSELFDKGVAESINLINFSLAFMRGEAGEEELTGRIKDISYSGKYEGDQRANAAF